MRSMFQTACSDRKVQRKSLKIREEFIPLKSLGGNTVPVQVRSPAPIPENLSIYKGFRVFVLSKNTQKTGKKVTSKKGQKWAHPSNIPPNFREKF